MLLILPQIALAYSYTDPSTYIADEWAYKGFSLQDTCSIFDQVGALVDTTNIVSYGVDFTFTPTFSSVAGGSGFGLFGADLDGDNTNELVGCNGNLITVYKAEDKVLNVAAEFNMGAPCASSPNYIGDYDSDGYNEFVVASGTSFYFLEYDGAAINADTTVLGLHGLHKTVPVCKLLAGIGEYKCLLGSSHTGGANISVISPLGTFEEYAVGDNDTFYYFTANISVPPLDDVDVDGIDELIMPMQFSSAEHGGVIIWDTYSNTTQKTIEATAQAGVTRSTISGVSVFNFDKSGTHEIWMTYTSVSGINLNTWVEGFKPAGTTLGLGIMSVSSGYTAVYVSNPVFVNMYNTTVPEICAVSFLDTTIDRNVIACFDMGRIYVIGASIMLHPAYINITMGSTQHLYYGSQAPRISAADMEVDLTTGVGEDGIHNIILGAGAASLTKPYLDYTANQTSWINYTDDINSFYDNASTIAVDLNRDGVLDICAATNGITYCILPNYENQPPQLQNKILSQNYVSPVCAGTTVTYRAAECGTNPCQYTNDVPQDQERLISTCGTNASYFNGTWADNYAEIGCYYNQVGSYAFEVILQDDYHVTDFSQKKDMTIYVINGTAGRDCNLAVDPAVLLGNKTDTLLASNESALDSDAVKAMVDEILGVSTFIKNVLVLILTLGLLIGLVKLGVTNAFIYIISIFVFWLILAMIGMMSMIYVMIFGVVLAAIAVLAIMGSKAGGDGK